MKSMRGSQLLDRLESSHHVKESTETCAGDVDVNESISPSRLLVLLEPWLEEHGGEPIKQNCQRQSTCQKLPSRHFVSRF